MIVSLPIVKDFFFYAMLKGYAADVPKTKVPDMPGYKEIRFQEGDFLLVDRYCVTPGSPKSAGTTTIWFQNNPVWVMNYGGLYEKPAIPFLKSALLRAYEASQFFGGRGPFMYSEDSLVYVNQPRLNDFAKFEGRDEVFDLKSITSLGFHEYWGMSLL